MLFDSEGTRVLISHLDKRRKLYLGVFAIGFVSGYPIAEMVIEWLLNSDGYIPTGVEVIILQPLEVILLQLRIAAQIAFGLTVATIIGGLLGYALDYFFGSKPWGLVVGIVFGVAAGCLGVYRAAMKLTS